MQKLLPQISIIIPVYNAGPYIERCLNSIFQLSFEVNEYEIIVIDDCSTDNTLKILQTIAEGHPNMVVLHQEKNQRQGAARNRGIEIARGEYIAFCDADDEIVADGVMNALYAIEKSHVDICYFDFEYEKPNGEWQFFEMPQETHNTILSASDYLNHYYTCYYNAPWRNLYRADFLRKTGIRFEEGVRWEDCDWTVKVYTMANEIQFVEGVGYRYAQNSTNTNSQTDTPLAVAEQLYAGLRLLDFSSEIKNELNGLSKTLRDETYSRYIIGKTRFRYLSRYTIYQILQIYSFLGDDKRKQLNKYSFGRWTDIVLRHKYMALTLLLLSKPIMLSGRFIKRIIRTKCKKE